ncbi:hypothetical protein [Dysgonomonas sp.]|uniref:hypothetical protein n=1 Tax=Dysgonomonas sp. TaxID=1891233 RepID=UPI0027B88DD4|nr:hypothetical protein [Dysgonomonas sp.]
MTLMTRYNKSKIMKLAQKLRKQDNLTMSQALTLAWSKARRDTDNIYRVFEVRKPAKRNSIQFDMNQLADSLSAFYSSGAYTGD